MRKLETVEEINALREKKAIKVFDNFYEILCKKPVELEYDGGVIALDDLMIFVAKYYLGEDCDIYDLGNGYYMFCDKQNFHKAANEFFYKGGVEEKLPDFDHTTEIYKIVD